MADPVVEHIGENSPEQVAYKLLRLVAYAEDKKLDETMSGTKPDRKWIVEAYIECLHAVEGARPPDKEEG